MSETINPGYFEKIENGNIGLRKQCMKLQHILRIICFFPNLKTMK